MHKLEDAEHLFRNQDRPFAAELLIVEATTIFRERQDFRGLGHAYRNYGELLMSPAVTRSEALYRRDGFRDDSVTFDNRLDKAAEYFRMSLDSYQKAEGELLQKEQFDLLTNLYLNMGTANHLLGNDPEACASYTKMVAASVENRKRHPDVATSEAEVDAMASRVRKTAQCD